MQYRDCYLILANEIPLHVNCILRLASLDDETKHAAGGGRRGSKSRSGSDVRTRRKHSAEVTDAPYRRSNVHRRILPGRRITGNVCRKPHPIWRSGARARARVRRHSDTDRRAWRSWLTQARDGLSEFSVKDYQCLRPLIVRKPTYATGYLNIIDCTPSSQSISDSICKSRRRAIHRVALRVPLTKLAGYRRKCQERYSC